MRHLTAPLIAALLLTGCSTGPRPPVAAPVDEVGTGAPASPTAPAPTETVTASPPAAPPSGATSTPTEDRGADPPPPFTADTLPDHGDPDGDLVTLTDIRTGVHAGYDRIVLDVGGSGRPGWDVRYVPVAQGQASGLDVEVAGTAVLEVMLSHTGYPDDTGVAFYDGPRRLATGGTSTTEVVLDSAFEGTTQLFVGTDGERPFRVRWLDGRVVIDVGS